MRTLAAALFAVTAAATAAAFDYDSYQPSTLKDVVSLDSCGEPGSKHIALTARKESYRVRATWTGDLRAVDPSTSEVLDMAQKANTGDFGVPMRDLFKREAHVAADGVGYWLPIQEPIIAYFEKEAAGGKPATLFVTYFGCSTKVGKTTVVTINEFDAENN
jgi:hypothetical protein